MRDFAPFLPLVGALLALVGLICAFRSGRRRCLIDNLPTSKTSGVFIGFVELKGTAEVAEPLTSYLAEQRCVHYSWTIEEHWSRTVTETYTDSNGKTQTRTRHESGWTTVGSGGKTIPFYLQDDCGVILVRPSRAKIEPATLFDDVTKELVGQLARWGTLPTFTAQLRERELEEFLPVLKSWGMAALDTAGIEPNEPNAARDIATYVRLAQQHGLAFFGGSDYRGVGTGWQQHAPWMDHPLIRASIERVAHRF